MVKVLEANKLPQAWGMKITGHTQEKTYRRYIKTDDNVARLVGEALKNLDDEAA